MKVRGFGASFATVMTLAFGAEADGKAETDERKAIRLTAEKAEQALPAAWTSLIAARTAEAAAWTRYEAGGLSPDVESSCEAGCGATKAECLESASKKRAEQACREQEASCLAACVAERDRDIAQSDAHFEAVKAAQKHTLETDRLVTELRTAIDADRRVRPWPSKPTCPAGMLPVRPGTLKTVGDHFRKPETVTVSGFCMDRTEVTASAYLACVKSGQCTPTNPGELCNATIAEHGNHPINCVTGRQARWYCQAQGKWLPTEDEWEYAARGTDGRRYPWGHGAPKRPSCWGRQGESTSRSTCQVGAYPVSNSPFGLADMAGNVWEWASGQALISSDLPDFHGVVLRGGGWAEEGYESVESTYRGVYLKPLHEATRGFRCAAAPLP
jgi:formylglycine-generating enzyme required for sulfatase activity